MKYDIDLKYLIDKLRSRVDYNREKGGTITLPISNDEGKYILELLERYAQES